MIFFVPITMCDFGRDSLNFSRIHLQVATSLGKEKQDLSQNEEVLSELFI